MPSSTSKLFPVGGSQCGVRCKKAAQDKVALMLSNNLRSVMQKSIVFRLPHRSEDKLQPIIEDSETKTRNRRRRRNGNVGDVGSEVGLLVGCPAGYGFRDNHCFPCSPGSHSDNMGSRCKKCPEGTHQPNAGARTCRTCTNPFIEGCYRMFWNSSSAVMAILVSLSAIITIFMILVWMLCCSKGKKSGSGGGSCARSTEIELKYQQSVADQSLRQPLLEPCSRDLTEDDERWCDCEKLKKKKRLMRKKLILCGAEAPLGPAYRPVEGRQMTVDPDEKTERVRTVPISCVDSYRSHIGGHSRNNFPQVYDYAKPPLPLPDFPR
ncbi:uncharacterized protein [Venturia canescens]|uniref:uncharacterized protein n=1 Tax=Venturia canescens TaxID=32260 RepID=UPI001C9C8C31|nr:uncharacterized protein LOC122413932 [Venturia canescens]